MVDDASITLMNANLNHVKMVEHVEMASIDLAADVKEALLENIVK